MKKYYTLIAGAVSVPAITIVVVLAILVCNSEKPMRSVQPVGVKTSLTNTPTGSTLASIQNEIARREYHITYDSAHHALQSPNRLHNLRAYYRPGRLSIQNRIDSTGQNFRMELVNEGVYADGKLVAKPESDAVTNPSNDTLTITHDVFSEEFINNQAGIRQNFIVSRAPAHTRELSVHLSLHGLHARQPETDHLVFYSDNGGKQTDRLTYSDLKCWDAEGKPLTARIALSGKQIEINVNVANAAFPVTIDPIIANGNPANADKTLEINQSYAWLGYSVSTAGDVNGDGYSDVLIGAPKYDNGQVDEGAAFLYPGTASGISLAATVLECNQANAQMGYSVSNAGDINKDGFSDVLVGVPYYDESASNEGAVMIYRGSAGGLVTNNPYVFKLDQAEANLGISVAMAGDVNGDGYSDMLAGAHQFDNGQSNEGVGVLILGAPNGLGSFTFLECNQKDAMMGFAVAGAGDVDGDGFSDVMAGARFYSNGQALEGAAFIFKGSGNGVVTANPTVIESNQVDARLGHALSSAGDVNGDGFSDIALGAYQYDKGSNNEGAVMIHYGSANGINTVPALTLESDQTEAQFGISVACAGDVNADSYADLIVGARYYDKGQVNEGAAFIYQGSQSGLNATPVSVVESNQGDAWLGSAVAPAGDVNGDGFSDVLVGSYAFDNGQKDEGSVFVWYGGAEKLSAKYANIVNGIAKGMLEGQSVANAGDVNGDGFNDIIIGTPTKDSKGAAYIYHGSPSGINTTPSTSIENISGSGVLGFSVAGAGDVNGDGYDDVIIGDFGFFISYDAQKNILIEGAAIIFYGSQLGINLNTKTILPNTQENSSFGWSVAGAGDVNHDGYDDILVGDPNHDIQFDEGAAHVYYGSAQGVDVGSKLTLTGEWTAESFGISVSTAGDINGDGFSDIVVGVPFYSWSELGEGSIVVYYGSISGITPVNSKRMKSGRLNANLGSAVSSAGDINGDGFSDIIAGAENYTNGQDYEGAAMIFYGSNNGIGVTPTILECNIAYAQFGNSVAAAGDLNGDGYGDLLVSGSYSGSLFKTTYIMYGSTSGPSPASAMSNPLSNLGLTDKDYMKRPIGAGDVNGDGRSDIVGEIMSLYDEAGKIFSLVSSGAGSPRNNLRLYNTDLTTPINHTQFPQNYFGAGLFAKSFTGRNKGKLVWETKPTNQGFSKGNNNRITNSTQSTSSQNAYSNLGTTGYELKNLIDKQGPGTKVRVRVKYDPVLALTGQSYGPWRYLPAYLMGNSTAPVPEEGGNGLLEINQKELNASEDGKALESAAVYPNPVSNRLNLDLKDKDQVQNLKILTAAGSVVYQLAGFQSSIDVSKIPEGAYFLIITQKDGSHNTSQILIRR